MARDHGSDENERKDSDQDGGIAVETARPKLAQPPKYAVILHNDDYTSMEFVVEVLKKFFHRSEEEAMQVMLKVHHEGSGVAGIYSHEIAETKVVQVHEYARSRQFPLKCSLQPA